MKTTRSTVNQQQGFTITQMVITISIIAVVSTFGVLGIRTARAEFQHQSAARLFASYVERARADAIRRHAPTGQESSIETFGPGTTSYAVTMDWGDGVVETRTFELDSGLTFDTNARKVSFDWRGRITEAWVFQIKSAYLGKNVPVDVSGSGDITVGEQHFPDQMIPDVVITQVTGDGADATPTPTPTPPPEEESPTPEPDPEATPTPTPEIIETDPGHGNGGTGGNGNIGGGNGNGNGQGSPTPTPTPTPTPDPDNPIPQCASMISPTHLFLSQSDSTKKTGTATFSMANATGVRTISAAQAANGNSMVIALSLQRIDGSGSSVISVTTKQGGGNRGEFVIEVSASPGCGSTQKLTVSISN